MSGSAGLAGLRIVVLDDYQDVARAQVDWERELPGARVTFLHETLRGDALVAACRGHDVLVAMRERTPLDRATFARLPELRLLVTTGGKRNNSVVDYAAARSLGITACGTTALPWGAAELAWALILAVAKHVPAEDARVRAGLWQGSVGMSLHGATLGVLGAGKLGTKVAEVGRAFGMRVVAWSPHLTAARAAEAGAELVTREALFALSDVISIHLVLAESTRGIVGEREFRAMKPTAILVNTSRGPLVDEAALLRALDEGRIGGAGLDVYDEEPLPADHPLRRAPRTVLTPHVGYVTDANFRHFFREVVEDIQAFVRGTPVREIDG